MRSKLLTDLAVAVGFLMLAGPMFAHHSSSIYDREHPVTLKGTVTVLELINPHSLIRFEVKDDKGNIEKWVPLRRFDAPDRHMVDAGAIPTPTDHAAVTDPRSPHLATPRPAAVQRVDGS